MAGIITDSFKRVLLNNIISEVATAGASYYIGLGNSVDWDATDTAPTPVNTLREERNLRLKLQSIKSGEDVSFVVPRNNWTSGTIYSGWDDSTVSHPTTPYFVITGNNSVFMCLKQARDATGSAVASTIEPSGASQSSYLTADGYTWKFLYTLSAGNTNKFLSANYFPVAYIATTDSASAASLVEQKAVQDAAVAGQIGSIRIVSGGTGYSSAPTVTINGDGSGCLAKAVVFGGAVVDIKLDSDGSGNVAHGSGYTKATVAFSSGVASARAAFSPAGGFGSNALNDLRAKAIMFNSKISGGEDGTFVTDNDFRQVVLLKNPTISATDSDFSGASSFVLNKLNLNTPVIAAFSPDGTIQGETSGAVGYIDTVNNTTGVLYYHQTEETGFTSFINGEALEEIGASGAGNIVTAESGYIDFNSGEVLYIENRAAVPRSEIQTEDIKIVIQL